MKIEHNLADRSKRLGAYLIDFDRQKQGWHDKISKTFVVNEHFTNHKNNF